jgi:hypothetical protein
MTRTIAAAIFALLALTAPVCAATIQWNLDDVSATQDPEENVSGFFDYNTTTNTFSNFTSFASSAPNVYPFELSPQNFSSVSGSNSQFTASNSFPVDSVTLSVATGGLRGTSGSILPLIISQSSFCCGIGGYTYTLQGSISDVSAVPVPAAFPLFRQRACRNWAAWAGSKRGGRFQSRPTAGRIPPRSESHLDAGKTTHHHRANRNRRCPASLRALMKKLAPGDVVITPAVDRLSRDTTDLLVIARDTSRTCSNVVLMLPGGNEM